MKFLIDLMSGKDVKEKVANKLEKVENKLSKLATIQKEYELRHGVSENRANAFIEN